MRITRAYPPPLPPAAPVPPAIPTAAQPRVTRYARTSPVTGPRTSRQLSPRRSRHRAPQPLAARAWAATSVVLAAAGVAAVVVLPSDVPAPTRLDVPVVVVAAPATIPEAAAAPAAQAAAPPLVLPLAASPPVSVRIPALGVTSEVMRLGLERDGSMEVPSGAYPVGWYDRSPTPGELGPAVIAGHVDWDGEPGAFYGLRELLPGDEVVVGRADGGVATFRVDRVEEHDKEAFPTGEVYGDIPTAGLRLITCGGSFDEDSGDYRQNVIVYASLVATH